ncbi:unnamed protein product, partial [Ectocarpus fasciculatus]
CNLHDELGAIGRLPAAEAGSGSDSINNLVASIHSRRAEAEARLEQAAAAMVGGSADPTGGGAAASTASTERRMRRGGASYMPKTRR